jgi:hypothetical protein
VADVWRRREEFEHANARVVVVSFMSSAEMASDWDSQVGHRFLHVFEPGPDGRAGPLYQSVFRFRRSLAGVWSKESLSFYAEQKAAGRELESSRGLDVHQMAGDFVLDPSGTVSLAYYSKTNTDRPTVDALLEAVPLPKTDRDASSSWSSGALIVATAAIGALLTLAAYHWLRRSH